MPTSSRLLPLLTLFVWACCSLFAAPQSVEAQPASTQQAQSIDSDKPLPLGPSSLTTVTLAVQWQLWKQVVSEQKDGQNELVALHQSMKSRGQRNNPTLMLGAIAWLNAQDMSGAQLAQTSAHLWRLGPDMPHGYLVHAYWSVRHKPSAIGAIARSIPQGVSRLWTWPDMGTMWRFNLIGVLLLATMLASAGFLLAQTIRHFGTLCFDAARLMPKSISKTQSTLIVLALIVLPGLILGSPLLIALTLLGMLGIVQQLRERLVTLALFALVAALPSIEAYMSHEATFHTSDAHVMFEANYTECLAPCESRLQAMQLKRPQDSVLKYTQLLHAFRQGHPQTHLKGWSLQSIAAMPKSIQAAAMNLYGASLAARLKHDKAFKALKMAATMAPAHAGPHLNLMRVAQAQGRDDDVQTQLNLANTIDLMGTTAFIVQQRRDINSTLWVDPLPPEVFMQHSIHVEHVATLPVLSRVWPSMAGSSLPFGWSVYLGGAGFLIVFLTLGLALKTHISTPCPQCSLPRAPQDGAASGDHPYCSMCYSTFIDGVSLTPQQRANNEDRLSAQQRARRVVTQVLSMILPGTGHVLAGRAVMGFLLSVLFFVGVLFVGQPHGVWPASHALFDIDWFGLRALSWICLGGALLCGLIGAWKGIDSAAVRTRTHAPKNEVHHD